MKRKRLQALCKKHGIPANLKNKEMADRLSFIFKEKEIEDPVGFGNAGTKKDINVEMIDLVIPSSGLEERSVIISAKNLKGSEIERLDFEMNLSPEITRGDFGICGVEEDMKSGLNEEQVVNSQGGLDSAPVVVALEEFNNPLVEGEVEKLGDENKLLEDVCENQKGRDEAAEQGCLNSPQGSNMKDVNILHVSHEQSVYPMVEEDEAVEQGDHSSPLGSNMKDVNVVHVSHEESVYPMVEEDEVVEQGSLNSPQGSNMKEVNVLHVSQKESGHPVIEEEEVAEQGDHSSPLRSNMKDVNVVLEESAYPMVEEDEAVEQGDHNSSLRSIMKDVNVVHVSHEESVYHMMEEDEAAEQGDHSSPLGSNMKDVNVDPMVEDDEAAKQGNHDSLQASSMNEVNALHVSQEESGHHVVEENEAAEQGDNHCTQGSNMKVMTVFRVSHEDVYPMVEDDEAVEQGNHNSPQASNIKDVNVLHVSPEESGYPMEEKNEAVEQGNNHSTQGSNMKDMNVLHVSQEESGYLMVEEVQKSDDNLYSGSVCNLISEVDAKDTDGKTNLTAEGINKYSVGTPDQFQRTYPENEVKSSGLNIHQDTCERESKMPQKTGPIADPGECVGFPPNNIETSAIKGFQAETYFDPSTLGDVEGTCNMKERTQSVKMEGVEHFIDEFHSSTFNDSHGTPVQFLSSDASNVKSDLHEMVVSDIVVGNPDMSHATSSVMDLNNEDLVPVSSVEVGDNSSKEEVEKSGLLADSEECIGFIPNNLEPSAAKGFQAETYFDSSTLGDVVGTCNMEQSMQSNQMEKEYSQEVLIMTNELERSMEESDPMDGEVTRLFDNSDDHYDAGRTEAEDKSQHYIKSDMDSVEKYLLNDFQSIEDAVGQNSNEKLDEYAPTVPQSVEVKSCTFNLQQVSASDTVSGDEGNFQEKLETPTKCTLIPRSEDSIIFYPNLESSMMKELIAKSMPVKRARDVLGGASDMKENIKIAKKEQVGKVISRSAFPKRKPLQDLQQN